MKIVLLSVRQTTLTSFEIFYLWSLNSINSLHESSSFKSLVNQKNWIITLNFCSHIFLCFHIYVVKFVTLLYPLPVKLREGRAIKLDRYVRQGRDPVHGLTGQGTGIHKSPSVWWLDLVVWEGNGCILSHPRTTWGSGDGCRGRQGSWALHTLVSPGEQSPVFCVAWGRISGHWTSWGQKTYPCGDCYNLSWHWLHSERPGTLRKPHLCHMGKHPS